MIDVMEIAKRIEEARTDMGISKKELAERINVSAATITRYEKGQFADPKIPVLAAIATVLNVNPAWICLRSENKNDTEKKNGEAGAGGDGAANADEASVLSQYRRLSPEGKQYIHAQLRFRLGDEAEEKEKPDTA